MARSRAAQRAPRLLLLAATLGGCSGTVSYGLLIDRCGETGPLDRLTVTVLGTRGALVVDRTVPEEGGGPPLPGRLRIEANGNTGALRILATGWRDGLRVAYGALQVASAEQSAHARLCLESPFPSDIDADGVPDAQDGCPAIPDPDQADADGDGRTDICGPLPDGGAPANPDGAVEPADRGLPFGDLIGPVDATLPPPPDAPVGPCPVGTACDDGDKCTTGDLCDTQGVCRGFPAADGHSCGGYPSHRCCGGQCVNIAYDPKHCGGCNLACAPGRTCSGVGATTECPIRPEHTSGRCICGYGDDSQCPNGQTCRATDPVRNRCSPGSASQCAPGEKKMTVENCPNYCYY